MSPTTAFDFDVNFYVFEEQTQEVHWFALLQQPHDKARQNGTDVG